MGRYEYDYHDATHGITLERLADGRIKATIGERVYHLHTQSLADGGWLVSSASENRLIYGHRTQDMRYVHVEGVQYPLERQYGRRQKQRKPAHAGDMNAQMPGQIMEILVAEGDTVTSGQALLVMEAMKMEIRISANRDGIVKHIMVEQGQIVGKGQLLIELSSMTHK